MDGTNTNPQTPPQSIGGGELRCQGVNKRERETGGYRKCCKIRRVWTEDWPRWIICSAEMPVSQLPSFSCFQIPVNHMCKIPTPAMWHLAKNLLELFQPAMQGCKDIQRYSKLQDQRRVSRGTMSRRDIIR